MGIPAPSILPPNERGQVVREVPWWQPRQAWPADLRYTDGRTETVIDRAPLPPPEPPGGYTSCAQRCVDARFAENVESDVTSRIRL
jgi:hypothetical protein